VNPHVNPHAPAHVNLRVPPPVNPPAPPRPIPGQFQHAQPHAQPHVNLRVPSHVNPHAPAHVNPHAPAHVNPHAPAHVNLRVPPPVNPPAPPRPIPGQFQHALPPRAYAPPVVPHQEMLAPTQKLAGNWPEVRPNAWRVGRESPPPAPSFPPERPSWLLELDDASIPPAHPSFVLTNAPTNASFHDETAVAQRVAPWFVRSLCVFAGLFLCAVVTRTVLWRAANPPAEPSPPVQPIALANAGSAFELVAPGDDGVLRARPGQRPTKPASKNAVGASATTTGVAASSLVELDAIEAPESPALVVYDLPAATSAGSTPAAGQDLGREDVDRWLAEQSRASAPLSDVGAIRAGEPSPPGTATPTSDSASGIWEGATIPVEALAGGLRLETPSVGRVRVRLEGGGRAEGKLIAIGRGRVWIETDSGPLEVETAKMRGLEQIAEQRVASGARNPERQRVRTAGGVFYGRVLARDGRTVTLITDAGARVTVEADEIGDADPAEGN